MARALHHPKTGYYNRPTQKIGRRGDFTTAPELSSNLAAAIASWLKTSSKKYKIHSFIEIGPGLGTLTSQVLAHLPLHLRLRSDFHLVESSPTLTALQNSKLPKRTTHHADPSSALRQCNGRALIYHNELVDAFPVRIFEKRANQWLELMWDPKNQTETLRKPPELPPSSAFSQPFPENQRIEVHQSYQKWLQTWTPLWKSGEMLTIDYGNTIDKLYHRRPAGSIRAYSHQILRTGREIYQNPGLQDITADVNFTDLIQSKNPKLHFSSLIDLSSFLKPFSTAADQHLHNAATHFQVLRQQPHPHPPGK